MGIQEDGIGLNINFFFFLSKRMTDWHVKRFPPVMVVFPGLHWACFHTFWFIIGQNTSESLIFAQTTVIYGLPCDAQGHVVIRLPSF